MKNILGTTIKRMRKERRLTQNELGKLTGFSQNTVSQHESGARVIDEKAISKYAKALNTTPQSLFDDYDKKGGSTISPLSQIEQLYTQLDGDSQQAVLDFINKTIEDQAKKQDQK